MADKITLRVREALAASSPEWLSLQQLAARSGLTAQQTSSAMRCNRTGGLRDWIQVQKLNRRFLYSFKAVSRGFPA